MKKVLKASAGTGKTYRLSLEYLIALLSGQDYKEIAVLTFTRKATAEARERIFEHMQSLEEKGENSEVWQNLIKIRPHLEYRPQLIRNYRRQMLQNKEMVQIYTIDSFINRIFKEVVVPYLGIYNYEIIEGEGNEEAVKEIFRRMLENEEYFYLLENISQFKVDRNFDKILTYIEVMLDERWKFLLVNNDDNDRNRKSSPGHNYIEALEGCLQILEEVAAARGDEVDKNYFKSKFRNAMNTYFRLKDRDKGEEFLRKHILKHKPKFLLKDVEFWNGTKLRGKKYRAQKEELNAHYQIFREGLAHYILEKELFPLEKDLFKMAQVVFKEYDRLKLTQKSFTHSDISNYVYKYVVRGELELPGGTLNNFLTEITGEEIKSLFIDEFQDTSVLQWKILEKMLTEDRNFIAVGDAKQSIYQWRGGEKELFIRLPRLIEGEEETLPVCYRSDEQVLNFINRMFLNLSRDWDYEEVEPHPDAEEGYVNVLLGGSRAEINEETDTFAKLDESKQEAIKEQNRNLIKDMPQYIAEKLNNSFDNYEGVAVLARRNSDLNNIADKLAEFGIPYIKHQEGDLLQNEAVWPLYQLLLFFWRGEYHCLLNFLRSDLVQMDSSSLKFMLQHREEIESMIDFENGENISLQEEELFENRIELAGVLEWIRTFYLEDYQDMTFALITESGVLSLAGEDRGLLKNIFRFYTLLKEQDSLADFMEFCREEEASSRLQEVSVQGENAVDLLTVHKAKGLSFDTVFFYWKPFSLSHGGFGGEDLNFCLGFDPVYEDIEEYLLFPSRYSNIMPWVDFSFQEEMEEDELNEEINNVYVAMTRAVHNLFLCVETPVQIEPGQTGAWADKHDYGFYEPALLAAAGVDSLTELIEGREFGEFAAPEPETEREMINTDKVALYFRQDKESGLRKEKMTADYDYNLDLKTDRDRIQGLAIHHYLENITTGSEEERELARRLVTANYGNILGSRIIKEAIERAETFIKENKEYFADCWQVFTEYVPTSIGTEDKESRIDRLLVDREDKKIVIIDYKSGLFRQEEQLDRYRNLVRQEVGEEYDIETEFVSL